MDQFRPENGTSQNSTSTLRFFFKFCTMNGADRYMKILLVAF